MGVYSMMLEMLERAGVASFLEAGRKVRLGNSYVRAVAYHATPRQFSGGFRHQMKYLSEHFQPLNEDGLRDFLAGRSGRGREKPGLVVTFDDGLYDQYETAVPILEEFRIPGWFFVTSTLPALPAASQLQFCRDATIVPGTELLERAGRGLPLAMGKKELADLSRRGHVIGCHTAHHLRFEEGIDQEIMRKELSGSREWLAHCLGHSPRSFAWVGGEKPETYAGNSRECIADSGFEFAFTTKSSPILRDSDPLVLHRTVLDPWLAQETFRMKIAGASDLAHARSRHRIEEGFKNARKSSMAVRDH